jgi:HK97 gp10 family phage protein
VTESRLLAQLKSLENINAVEALMPAGKILRDASKEIVPVDTGNLKAGIRVEELPESEHAIMVVAGGNEISPPNKYQDVVNYAAFVEFGTSRTYAQPYIRPSLDNNQENMDAAVKANIEKQMANLIRSAK